MNQISMKLLEMLAEGKFPDSASFFIRCNGIASITESVAPVVGWVIGAIIAACFLWKFLKYCHNNDLQYDLDQTKRQYNLELTYWRRRVEELQEQLKEARKNSSN